MVSLGCTPQKTNNLISNIDEEEESLDSDQGSSYFQMEPYNFVENCKEEEEDDS
jgi:hypothetical protein